MQTPNYTMTIVPESDYFLATPGEITRRAAHRSKR